MPSTLDAVKAKGKPAPSADAAASARKLTTNFRKVNPIATGNAGMRSQRLSPIDANASARQSKGSADGGAPAAPEAPAAPVEVQEDDAAPQLPPTLTYVDTDPIVTNSVDTAAAQSSSTPKTGLIVGVLAVILFGTISVVVALQLKKKRRAGHEGGAIRGGEYEDDGYIQQQVAAAENAFSWS